MTEADKAFTVAAEMIAKAKREGEPVLNFDTDETRALTDLPPGIAELTGLQELWLTNTQISDAGLVKIAGLTALQALYLSSTKISDAGLAKIAGMTGLQALWLNNTQISDLRLLRVFTKLLEPDHWGGLRFEGCAAAEADPQIAKIAAIADNKARAQALFDLIDAGWVPPLGVAEGVDSQQAKVPDRRPAPMEVVVGEDSIDLLHGGSLPKADANSRAEMGWAALKDYRDDFAASFNIGNYAPLPAYLAAFDRAMGDEYDAANVIRIGVQGRRFVGLSLDESFLKNLPDGAGSDLKNFAAEVLIYINRFPDWVAYREDADDISPEAVRGQADSFNAVRRAIDTSPEASDAVKAEYAAEVALGTALNATAEEATGIVATTGEFTRALAQADKDRQKRNRDGAKHASDLWNKTVVAPLGMPKMVALRLEAPLRELSAAYPGRLGWIIDWYDVTFGKPEDRD